MHDHISPKLSRLPFFLGDGLLVGLACFIAIQGRQPLDQWQVLACTVCVVTGAGLGVFPFLLEYRLLAKLVEADRLTTVVAEMQKLELLTAQIDSASSRWNLVHESAEKTANIATEIADKMAAEVRDFNEFLQRADNGERSALRLEVDKLRRAEGDWLKVLVRMLDHVFALHQAGLRSGQPALIEQLGHFQNACRDAARRVGLAAFVASSSEPFDTVRHQLVDGDYQPALGATVLETVAAGYTFQGKLLRQALVRLRESDGTAAPGPNPTGAGTKTAQDQLPVESANLPQR